jgi:hypothetical protein
MNGIRRKPYQVLPNSGAKITCVEINDHGFNTQEWFERSVEGWQMPKISALEKYRRQTSRLLANRHWDFVLVIPWISVRSYWAGNDGMQAWRHRTTGYVVPDHCRQTGGCPEVWNADEVKGKKELKIANLVEIEEFVVLEHRQVTSPAFPEHRGKRVNPSSSL